MSDEQVKPLLNGSLKGLLDNAATFPKPPVDLAAYQAAIAAFEAAIQQQVDGNTDAVICVGPVEESRAGSFVNLTTGLHW